MRSHDIDVAKAGKEGGVEFIAHLSTQLGLECIKRAQALGQRVFTETCPQYMLLGEEEMVKWGPLAKIGPPLRNGKLEQAPGFGRFLARGGPVASLGGAVK